MANQIQFTGQIPFVAKNSDVFMAMAVVGIIVFMVMPLPTLLLDLLVARRGFCRYLCPGGALYSLLGRYRLLRIKRDPTGCNDCSKCNAICEFGLDPMRDSFGQECNNCTACMAACPTDVLRFTLNYKDLPYQGPGHLGHQYRAASGDSGANTPNAQA